MSREELAVIAWREILAGKLRPRVRTGSGNPEPQDASALAYEYADAFISAGREKA